MGKITELSIGPWPDMRFVDGDTNRVYGLCKSIKPSWNTTKQASEGGEWIDSEYTAIYDVECVKLQETKHIYFNQSNPDLVVVTQD